MFMLFKYVICTTAFLVPTAGQRRAYNPGDVTLGALLPLHEKTSDDRCGEFFRNGLDYVEALTFAVNQVNADPDLLPNITLGYDIRDFCDSSALAMTWTHEFVTNNYLNDLSNKYRTLSDPECRNKTDLFTNMSSPIVAVVGPVDSDSCLVVANLLQVVGIPAISAFATSEELSTQNYDSFFRTVPPDGQQAKAIADLIEHFNWSYVAVVAVDHSYGRYGVRALDTEAYDRGTFCLAMVEYFPPLGYEKKIEAIVLKLKRKTNIKVIILWSTYTPGLKVTREAARQGLLDRTWLISEALTMQGPEFLGGSSVPVIDGFLGIAHRRYNNPKFETYLRDKLQQRRITTNEINPWWDEFRSIRKNTECFFEESVNFSSLPCEIQRSVSTDDYSAERAHITFVSYLSDAVYAIAHALDRIYKCKEPGGLIDAGRCPKTRPTVDPNDVLKCMRSVDFTGITGRIRFDSRGDRITSSYDIINFQASVPNQQPAYALIGTWDGSKVLHLKINESLISWGKEKSNGNARAPTSSCRGLCPRGSRQTAPIACCWECIKCPKGTISQHPGSENCTGCPTMQTSNSKGTACVNLEVVNIHWKDLSAIVFEAFAILGLFCVMVTAVIFGRHRKTPVVKASNRELSAILLLAIAMCYALTLLYLLRPTTELCYLIEAWRYIAYTLCVSVLFFKTNRIVRVFEIRVVAAWFSRSFINSKSQILAVMLLNSVQSGLLVLRLKLDPPFSLAIVKPGDHVQYVCKPFQGVTGLIIQGTILGYLFFLSLFCLFYAFKARKLPQNFNEARYIGFSMYILFLPWLTFYPMSSAFTGSNTTHIACAATLLSAYGLLGRMFAPNLYIMLSHPEKNTSEVVKAKVARCTIRHVDSRVNIGSAGSF